MGHADPVGNQNVRCLAGFAGPQLPSDRSLFAGVLCGSGTAILSKINHQIAGGRTTDRTRPRECRDKMVDEARAAPSGLPEAGKRFPSTAAARLCRPTWRILLGIHASNRHASSNPFLHVLDRCNELASHLCRYVHDQVPVERRAYSRPEDPPSSIEVAVTFPVHGHLTPYTEDDPLSRHGLPGHPHRLTDAGAAGGATSMLISII